MLINKIASLLSGIRQLVSVFDSTLIDVISSIVPWLAPLLPAYLVFDGLISKLHEPIWYGLVAGLVLEGFGLAAISTAISFWSYNQCLKDDKDYKIAKRKERGKSLIVRDNQTSPFFIALITVIYYFMIVLAITVAIEIDAVYIPVVIKAMLSSLTLGAGLLLAIRIDHQRRITKTAGKISSLESRKEMETFRKVTDPSQVAHKQRSWRNLTKTEKKELVNLSVMEISLAYGITERSARNWQRNLRSENY